MIAKLLAFALASAVVLPQVVLAKNGQINRSSQPEWRSGGVPYSETIPWLTAQLGERDAAIEHSVGPDLNQLQIGIGRDGNLISRYSSMSKKSAAPERGSRR